MDAIKMRNAPPRASGTIEALRGLGYTTETALADLIDNSIAAGATTVSIDFHWLEGDSWISLLDDGNGMADRELDTAMRLAEMSPVMARDPSDLGRFGMGLKTASFSQARRLTVASRKGGETSCLRWDLDFLAREADGGWYLLEGPAEGSECRLESLQPVDHGTLVLWEVLDRVVPAGFSQTNFLDLIDRVERHLSMVFHRFLDGSGPSIDLRVNGRSIKPWDPFLSGHPATWRSPEVDVGAARWLVRAQGFVLPHKDRLTTERAYEVAGGPKGWFSQQGFYVYRARRLLVAGSWLGLGRGRAWTSDESHRLARIRLDMPNALDADWRIDIRKSTAHPPVGVREQLTKLAEDVRDRARRVFVHRAQSNTPLGRDASVTPVWLSTEGSAGRRYRANRSHPAVAALLSEPDGVGGRVEAMLRVLEETIPVQRIWLDAAESGEQPDGGFAGEPDSTVIDVLNACYRNLVARKGIAPDAARRQLRATEPFDLYPKLVSALPDELPELGLRSSGVQ